MTKQVPWLLRRGSFSLSRICWHPCSPGKGYDVAYFVQYTPGGGQSLYVLYTGVPLVRVVFRRLHFGPRVCFSAPFPNQGYTFTAWQRQGGERQQSVTGSRSMLAACCYMLAATCLLLMKRSFSLVFPHCSLISPYTVLTRQLWLIYSLPARCVFLASNIL